VGITEFILPGDPIYAVIKYRYRYINLRVSRYSDFIVNEITLDGQIVKPVKFEDTSLVMEEEKKEEENIKIQKEHEEILTKLLGLEEFIKF
jgi:hypothetical protein